ncbi:hypothetical protein [Cytobacillus praedii]|uniref:DUF1292 domain-containing protein n=1 Tax=Cytobacillus praedii TaxID=1742358 RepID=A0A4R1AR60_9BACI|nr:hypothetical protein [Cytobacillus praedii]TCJ00499.1 hypothetical protein E0Y62_26615 [Cytobacillus praedii]
MSKIKILNTISMSLTEGKVYEVIKQNDWIDDDGNQQISITVLDDEGDEFIIVNSDEAEYKYLTIM